uniref:Uncharacterized protein n=1 Tax=Knipowitschia caucasica TaxID=637954 RepID=A0AAV2K4U1_KNICA
MMEGGGGVIGGARDEGRTGEGRASQVCVLCKRVTVLCTSDVAVHCGLSQNGLELHPEDVTSQLEEEEESVDAGPLPLDNNLSPGYHDVSPGYHDVSPGYHDLSPGYDFCPPGFQRRPPPYRSVSESELSKYRARPPEGSVRLGNVAS